MVNDYCTKGSTLNKISVFQSSDGLKAFILVPEALRDNYPSIEQLKQHLKQHKIVFGIKEDALQRMTAQSICNKRVCVAHGTQFQRGIAGYIEILLDTSKTGVPQLRENGSVDHKELHHVINVVKGDALLRRVPPQYGTEGMTVFGKPVPAPLPEDAVLYEGPGTKISEHDTDLLVAAFDGAATFYPDGTVEVRTHKIINGNIDYTTGNLTFSGDLHIKGNVRQGFSVKAEGNLTIEGDVEDSFLTSGGTIRISRGTSGAGNGIISCEGSLYVRHIENFTVNAQKDIFVADTILHSSVTTQKSITAKTIIGGQISFGHSLHAESIGAVSETKTVLKIGILHLLFQQKKLLHEKLNELQPQIHSNKEAMYVLVRESMDDNGQIPQSGLVELELLKQKEEKIISQIKELKEHLEKIEKESALNVPHEIKASVIFPNTIIRFGLQEKIIKEKLQHVVVRFIDDNIVVKGVKS